ncbi:MAG: hypothetical protein DMG80_09420 [Acidobacteria bacterium]|jgi:glycosyltransferase involved in cell wall biosynthesis|nr:MAG: hypothetical protein DMG80_09420 [Acidobacteriota bacterium]
MKILHISTGFPLSFPGGITNYVRTLARSQVALGNEVHILAGPEQSNVDFSGLRVHPYTGSTVKSFQLKNVEVDSSTNQIGELITRESFDLVHFHMSLNLPLSFYRDFSTLRVPYFVSLHDYYYVCPRVLMVDYEGEVCRTVDVARCCNCVGVLDQIDFLSRGFKKLGVPLPRIPSPTAERRLSVMRDFLEKANLLLPVSERTAEIYREVVPKGHFEVEHIGNSSALCTRLEKTPSDRIRAVFLGTLNRHKGAEVLERLLRAVNRSDLEFHFYGRAFEGFERKLRSSGVIFHGEYHPDDLPSIMSQADVGLVLSIWEDNGPQVAMEFINYGVPVIGTRRGGIPDFISAENGLLFDPDSPEELLAIAHWLNRISLTELNVMSAGMKRLKTPDEHSRRIQELYLKALASPSEQCATYET